jgi:transposase
MEITEEQYKRIVMYMPKVCGTYSIDNITALNGMLYLAENGCKRRNLPEKYGKWHSIYMKLCRLAKSGVLAKIFYALSTDPGIGAALDSTSVKAHPRGVGALKKNGKRSIGKSRGGLTAKIHILASGERTVSALNLSGGECHDCPEGIALLLTHGERLIKTDLLDGADMSSKAGFLDDFCVF